MSDVKDVIMHLQIIHTWVEFARERDLQFFTAKHLEDIAKWSKDAITELKSQEIRRKVDNTKMKDPYQKVSEDIAKALTKHSEMIVWLAKRTLSAKEFEELLEKFSDKQASRKDILDYIQKEDQPK